MNKTELGVRSPEELGRELAGALSQPVDNKKTDPTIPAQPVPLEDITPAESASELHRELKKQIREPFTRALQRLLKFRPTPDALQKFADKSPDRWAQAVSILAGLAGYEKGINVTFGARRPVDQMTDAELLAEHFAVNRVLAARAQGSVVGEVKDAEIVHTLPAPKVG